MGRVLCDDCQDSYMRNGNYTDDCLVCQFKDGLEALKKGNVRRIR